jgi:hypothetical protein
MGQRPELERFLPPPAVAGPPSRADTDEGRGIDERGVGPRRAGLARRRRLQTVSAGTLVLVIVGAATLAGTNAIRRVRPEANGSHDRTRTAALPKAQARKPIINRETGRRVRPPKKRRSTDGRRDRQRHVRVHVPIAAVSDPAEPTSPSIVRPVRARPSARKRAKPHKRTARKAKNVRRKEAAPVPAPPGLPLFHCFSAKRKDHYMTADQPSVGQMEESRADYDCRVIGYVYDTQVNGTKAIALDDGTSVYVFSNSEVRTEPECPKHTLYVHRGGVDQWYNTTESDEGVAGYICT